MRKYEQRVSIIPNAQAGTHAVIARDGAAKGAGERVVVVVIFYKP